MSYGSEQGFSTAQTQHWFNTLASEYPAGFQHVLWGSDIIGQLEFGSTLTSEHGDIYGYINLIYLQASHRQRGLGQALQDYVLEKFAHDGCKEAYLRYIPGNLMAERFYGKNGWQAAGDPSLRGQLMVKTLTL